MTGRKIAMIKVACEDCGRARKLPRTKLLAICEGEFVTVGDLASRLYCSHCRAMGGRGRNLRLWPVWYGPAVSGAEGADYPVH